MSASAPMPVAPIDPTGNTVVDVRDLTKVYRKPGASVAVHALRGVDVAITKGEYAAIMGQSGSGKSTLMNILGCLDQPTDGTYMLGDDDVSTLDDDALSEIRSRRIGFVFQQYNLIPQLTVRENLEVPMFYIGIPPKVRVERAEELALQVGMAERLDHRPWELSGGQQQRVCIARALMNDPLIILADEPTGALDSKTGVQILDIFDKLVEGGTTIVMVTHDPKIADHCPRVVTLCDGLVESDVTK